MDIFTKEILIKLGKLSKSKKQKIFDQNTIYDSLNQRLSVDNTCFIYLQAKELDNDIPKQVQTFVKWNEQRAYVHKGEKSYSIFKQDDSLLSVFAEYQVSFNHIPISLNDEKPSLECEQCKIINKTVSKKVEIDRLNNKIYIKTLCSDCFNSFKNSFSDKHQFSLNDEKPSLECEQCKITNKTVSKKVAIDRLNNKIYSKTLCSDCFSSFKNSFSDEHQFLT
jgi:Zn finger protein HypA/HybF involved in hydrogenase expression